MLEKLQEIARRYTDDENFNNKACFYYRSPSQQRKGSRGMELYSLTKPGTWSNFTAEVSPI
jgi:hypothetical protein